jgi:hypothetical protein
MHVHTTNIAVSSLRLCIRELTSSYVGQETGFYHWIFRGFPQFAQKNAGLLSHATKDFFPHFSPVYNPNVAVLFNGVCLKSRQHKAFISKPYVRFEVSAAAIVKITYCLVTRGVAYFG